MQLRFNRLSIPFLANLSKWRAAVLRCSWQGLNDCVDTLQRALNDRYDTVPPAFEAAPGPHDTMEPDAAESDLPPFIDFELDDPEEIKQRSLACYTQMSASLQVRLPYTRKKKKRRRRRRKRKNE